MLFLNAYIYLLFNFNNHFQISIPMEDFRNRSMLYNKFEIAEADKRFPNVGGFLKYINNLLPATKTLFVTDKDTINIEVPVFYDHLDKLLSRTPRRTLANYLFWRITESSAEYLNEAMHALAMDFQRVESGMENKPTRRIECVRWLKMR